MKETVNHTQPPEWEEKLRDVTVKLDYHEVPSDPQMLNRIIENTLQFPLGKIKDVFEEGALLEQIADIRSVVRRKFTGVRKNCFLILLTSGADFAAIAKRLKISEETVRRHIEDGTNKLQDYFQKNPFRSFPKGKGKRHVVQTALMPLDTDEEKTTFLQFINDHVTTHIAYSSSPPFREAMVIYLAEKAGSRYKTSV